MRPAGRPVEARNRESRVESRELNAFRAIGLGTLFFLALMLMRTSLLTHTPSPFIYFQF